MKYTRTALGLLSAQYRSVLKKCFLINLGLFALEAVASVPAMATETCPDGYKCYGENFGEAAEKYPDGEHAGEMITLADMVKSPYTGYNTKEIWSGDYTSSGRIQINYNSSGELIIRNSTIDLNGLGGFYIRPILPTMSGSQFTVHILDTEIKNGEIAQYGAGFDDEGLYYVQGNYGHNQIFENVTFTNNRVTGADTLSRGGGLFIKGGNDQLYPQADTQIVKAAIISTGDKRTEFNQNYVSNNNVSYYAFGGGLYNNNSELSMLDADFTGNYTKSAYMAASEDQFGSAGGAVINHLTIAPYSGSYYLYHGRGIINQIYGTYKDNYSTWVDENKPIFAGGGAIFNAATIGDIGSADKKAVFTGNYAKGNAQNASHVAAIGGAIANYGDPNISLQYTSSTTAKRYQGGTSGLGKIGNIYADFTDNYAQSVHGESKGARGGALANFKKNPLIGNVTGNFTGNKALTATNGGTNKVVASGGAISNEGIMGNVTGDFINNKAYNAGNSVAVGGAIYNTYALGYKFENNTLSKIGGIVNSNFYNNVAESTNGLALGGAIFTAEDLMIKADNGTSVFQGNKTISKSALADKVEENEAIYVNKSTSTSSPLLELVAVNGGTLTFYDSIDGSSGFNAHLTGDANSQINLYNDLKSAFITADSTNISTADGNIKEYSMYNLVADNTAKWTIDFSVEGEEADAFRTTTETEATGKVVQIDHFNLKDKAFNEITDKNFKVQILKTQGTTDAANLQLALTDQAASELGGEFVVTQERNTVKEAVTENTNWSHDFRETGTIDTTYGTLVLATTTTLNDSIGLNTRSTSVDYDESLGDTLMLVNTADLAKRNFNADQATYKVRDGLDDIGTTHAGELNVNGQGKDVSTLDGNGAALFDLSEAGTTVSLNDVKVTNAATVATLSASDAKLNLNNTEISGNNGEITASGGTVEAVNTNFHNNSGTEAGAIVSSAQVKIIANNGSSEIKGNTASQATSSDTAIYMKSGTAATPQLDIEAKNNGVVTIYDTIDGDNPYTVAITGDASGKVRLYNDINNADVSVEKVHIETTDDNGESHNYKLNSLNSNANAYWTIDFNVNAKTADNFKTDASGTASNGRVTLEALNLTDGEYEDITDDTFKVQILKTQGTATAADLQLALTDALKTKLATKFVMDEQDVTVDDPVNVDTDWSHEYKRTVTTTTKKGWLDLATSDTLNDSIGIYTEETSVDTKSKLDDTLKLVNTANLETRNFNADTATYTVSDGLEDIGTTHAGTLNVNGQGKDVSTLDGNGAALFDLSEAGTTVSLNDVKVTNAATVATLSASDAKLNLNNTEISGNNGEITASGGTVEAVNTNFHNNSGTEAGAIVSSAQVKIIANNGSSEIKGNTASQATSSDTAIYMKSGTTATSQLDIEAKNNGVVTIYDTIDGDNPYTVAITGDASGKVRLYNDINNADVSVEKVHIETTDDNGESHNYKLNSLTSNANANWTIDFNVNAKTADNFKTDASGTASNGRVTLEALNLTDGEYEDITDDTFKVQILKTQGTATAADLQLALTDALKTELAAKFVMDEQDVTVDDPINADTDWSHEYKRTVTTTTKKGWLDLATSDTLNDSIGIYTEETSVDTKSKLDDTLKLVNTANLETRNFNADTATYIVSDGLEDIGTTHAGTLNVNGQGKDVSTLDGNGAKLFDLAEAETTVALNDVKVTNAATVATLTASDAKLNLNNAEISGNNGEITASGGTVEAVNTNFHNNSGTEAGAIVSSAQVKIIANNGSSEIKGNTASQATSSDTAIYMKSGTAATPQLDIEAKNNGVVTIYDTIDGDNPYTVAITGDASGKVRLYNDINNADVSVDSVQVETYNDTVKDYSVNTLSSDAGAKWAIDVDVENKKADRFITAEATQQSGSVVTLDHFEQQNGNLQDVRDENFKVQILKTQGSEEDANLQLALSDNAKSELGTEFVIKHTETETTDTVGENTSWSDMLYKHTDIYTKYGQLGLATTDTLNDSIGVNTREESSGQKEWLGDTLKLVNQAELTDKNFNAGTANEVYTLEDDLGETSGHLTINGVADGEQKSTVDLNGHDSFTVPEGASLTLNDVVLKGGAPLNNAGNATFNNADVEGEVNNSGTFTAENAELGTVTNENEATMTGGSAEEVNNSGTFTAQNAELGTVTNEGEATITGGSAKEVSNSGTFTAQNAELGTVTNENEATITGGSVNGIINSGVVNLTNTEFTSIDGNDGVVNMLSDVDLSGKKVSNNKLVLQGVKATATTDSFGKNVDLVAESGSEVNVGNSRINLRKAIFGKDSQLTLTVDNLQTFGGIRADSFDIANGAKLDITFGQNPLDGKKTGEVALLSLSDGSDINNNNFSDIFHNNMYGFERKSEKSGIYGVYQTKTAEEISRENGGTRNNQGAAGAWVDGPSHPNPVAQDIANNLARLAQTDGVEFNKALTALAPNDDGMAQSALIDLTDRLLLTVDNHLIKSFMEGGLSSGDGRPDLSGVRAWVKTYYAESKLQRHKDVYGYKADARGFIAGVDKKITSSTKVGVGVQFDDTDVNAYHRDVNIQTLQGYVYGEYRPSNWFVHGVLSYGTADYDEDKHVVGRNIDAHYKANLYSVQGLTGYTFKYFTPEIGARYYKIKRHGYVDEALQRVSGNNLDLLRLVSGVKAETVYGNVKPHAYAGIMYDVISDRDNAVVSLGNGESYTVNGRNLPRFGVEAGIGATYAVTDKAEISVGYEAKFRKDYQDHSGWLNLKYAF